MFDRVTRRALPEEGIALFGNKPISLTLTAVEPSLRIREIVAEDVTAFAMVADNQMVRPERRETVTVCEAKNLNGVFLHIPLPKVI
jgi:hypothetical protein